MISIGQQMKSIILRSSLWNGQSGSPSSICPEIFIANLLGDPSGLSNTWLMLSCGLTYQSYSLTLKHLVLRIDNWERLWFWYFRSYGWDWIPLHWIHGKLRELVFLDGIHGELFRDFTISCTSPIVIHVGLHKVVEVDGRLLRLLCLYTTSALVLVLLYSVRK